MFSALNRLLRLLLVLLGELGLLAALVAAGRRPSLVVPLDRVDQWLRHAPPADVVVGLLRWLALAGAVWMLASTLLYLAAAASHVPAAARALRWSTLPFVRRTVDAAFAVSVVTGAVLAPSTSSASTSTVATTVAAVRDGRADGLAQLPPDETPPTPTTTSMAPPPTPSPAAPAEAREQVVAPGDNLWELAARQLATTTGRARGDLADADIAGYWVHVCDVNRPRLMSGDPNIVYPGERVVLPPVR